MQLMSIDSRLFYANVRSVPKFGNNIVGRLSQSDPVAVTGPKQGDRWLPCIVMVHNSEIRAFISMYVLRERETLARERLLRLCVIEYIRFDHGRGKEQEHPYFKIVGEYWSSLGLKLDGTDQDTPWSAAFRREADRKLPIGECKLNLIY